MLGLAWFISFQLPAQDGRPQSRLIEIKPVFAGKQLSLGKPDYVTTGGDTVSVERFRFYVSAIALVFDDGSEYHEANSYHLVDLEEPASLKITLPDVQGDRIKSVNFNIGVDSAASVSGALSGELDPVKGMYWAWNSGYINAKLEGACKSKTWKGIYEFHIGGYLQPYYALRHVTLSSGQPLTSAITLQCDAAAWFEGADLNKEHSIMIPGPEAMRVADRYAKMFSLAK